jgi:ankyrin repeat protein
MDANGKTPIQIAEENNAIECVELLKRYNRTEKDETKFFGHSGSNGSQILSPQLDRTRSPTLSVPAPSLFGGAAAATTGSMDILSLSIRSPEL